MKTATAFSGQNIGGFQLGSNSGHVNVNIHAEEPPAKPNPSSTVPFRQDPDFVDRDILDEVDKKCSKPSARVALVGLGGVGKSQIAIEYSYRVRKEFPQTWIFWVHASNAARFEQGYRTIADRIKLPRRNEPTADILQLVSNWLCDESNGNWIMILDNADDLTVFFYPRKGRLKLDTENQVGEALQLITFLPQSPNGSILVTSRSEDAAGRLTGSHHDIIKVRPMDEGCALLLLRKKLQCDFDEDKATELVQALDFMPLAISQAAARIVQRAPRTTIARYLEDFRKSDRNREKLLNTDAGDLRRDSNASNCTITTWQMSFDDIRRKRPSAARLLSLMSFFDRQGIPTEFLIHCYDDKEASSDIKLKANVDKHIESEDDSGMEFEEDIFTLKSYSLITPSVNGDQFEMHRLVQFSTKRWLNLNGELDRWNNKYIMVLSEKLPAHYGYESWRDFQTLFPHVETALAYPPVEKRYLVYWCQVLNNAGLYAITQGNYLTAEKMSRQVLNGMEKILDYEYPERLTSVSNLAEALCRQGKYEAAEKMSRQALSGCEKILGEEHPDTLMVVGNLASVLQSQGKYEAAEKMNQRALDGREKILGEEHPSTLSSVYCLAYLLHEKKQYSNAARLYERACIGYLKLHGTNHPNTLACFLHYFSMIKEMGTDRDSSVQVAESTQ